MARDSKALRAALATRARDPMIAELLATFDAVDDDDAVAAIVKELDASFVRYAREVKQPITAIRFYWAGAEVAPWVPSDVMGNVYVGKRRVLDSSGGFSPIPLPDLAGAAEDEALGDHEAFDDLRALFVAKSLELARRAVAVAVRGRAFRKLSIEKPFEILATPGHDTKPVVLITLPA